MTLLIDTVCNAWIPDAEPSVPVPGPAADALRHGRPRHDGLWVGGRVQATPEALTFEPNGMNKALHTGLQPVRIPLATVRAVRREFGWLTGIVVVEHAQGVFRFRCFGAARVARALSPHGRDA